VTTYITYHEWSRHLKDALTVDQSAGKLGRVAAQSGIPVDRLSRWLNKEIEYLSHAEFISLHEVLAETHVLGSESDAVSKIEESRKSLDALKPQQCGCSNCEDNELPFDESD
jgi:hypothetical protein